MRQRGGLARFPREVIAFPSKTLRHISITEGSSLWSERLFTEDMNTRSVNCSVLICFICPFTCSVQVYSCLFGGCTGQLLLYLLQVVAPWTLSFAPCTKPPLWFWSFIFCGVYYMNNAQLINVSKQVTSFGKTYVFFRTP